MMKFLTIMMLIFVLGCTRDETKEINSVVNVQKINLSQAEKDWIFKNPTIKYSAEINRAPYIWWKDDYVRGFSKDYIDLISKMTGIKFIPVRTENLLESMNFINLKKVDLITSIRATPERSEFLRFTPTFIYSNLLFAFNKDGSKVPAKVGVTAGVAANEYIRERFPKMEIITFSTAADVFEALNTKIIDMAVLDYFTLIYLSDLNKKQFVTTPIDFDYAAGIGYRREDEILGSILTKAVASISFEDRSKIIKRWVQ